MTMRRKILGLMALATFGTLALVPAGASASVGRQGNFTCTATAVKLGGNAIATANPGNDPCVDDTASALNVPLGALGGVDVASASTDVTPNNPAATTAKVGDNAKAASHLAGVTLGTFRLQALDSQATATCAPPHGSAPTLAGSSAVVVVNNGNPTVIDQPTDINLGLFVLHLNRTTKTSNSVTQDALALSSGTNDILVLGSATADFTGNPCRRLPDAG